MGTQNKLFAENTASHNLTSRHIADITFREFHFSENCTTANGRECTTSR